MNIWVLTINVYTKYMIPVYSCITSFMDGICAILCRNRLFTGGTSYKCSSLSSADVGINCLIAVYSSFSAWSHNIISYSVSLWSTLWSSGTNKPKILSTSYDIGHWHFLCQNKHCLYLHPHFQYPCDS